MELLEASSFTGLLILGVIVGTSRYLERCVSTEFP